MPTSKVDLIIIGGGINGAGIARDATMRGLKVLLVDKNDFAYGTSSRSTKLIHGGIRYLENYDFKLVWEACHERKTLTKIAPHLVHQLGFVFPVYKGDKRPAWLVKVGMFLYDLMAGFQNLKWHKNLSKKGILKLIPSLKKEGLKGGGIYYDAQTDDARLVLANIQDAADRGAIVKNYTEVATIKPHNADDAQDPGEVDQPIGCLEVVCQDVLTAEKFTYAAPIIINATGPWLDQNLKKWHVEDKQQISDAGQQPHLRLTKGIHFFIPKVTDEYALLIGAQRDGRVFFVIPWGEYSLVGTTDTDYKGRPDQVAADDEDRKYLIAELNRLFPEKKLGLKDIIADFAGLRPLLHIEGIKEGAVTREYKLKIDQIGSTLPGQPGGTMISVVGGKITTYRNLAEKVTNLVVKTLKNKVIHQPNCRTADQKLPGSNFSEKDFAEFKKHKLANSSQLQAIQEKDPEVAENLLNTYGSQIDRVLPYLNQPQRLIPESRIIPPCPVIWAQLFYGLDHEFIRTPEDFIRRRTELYIHTKNHPDLVEKIAEAINPQK